MDLLRWFCVAFCHQDSNASPAQQSFSSLSLFPTCFRKGKWLYNPYLTLPTQDILWIYDLQHKNPFYAKLCQQKYTKWFTFHMQSKQQSIKANTNQPSNKSTVLFTVSTLREEISPARTTRKGKKSAQGCIMHLIMQINLLFENYSVTLEIC